MIEAGYRNTADYAGKALSATAQRERASDSLFRDLNGRLNLLSEITDRIERAGMRLGGAAQGINPGGPKGDAPDPDTLTWRLQSVVKTLDALNNRLANAADAIEGVV